MRPGRKPTRLIVLLVTLTGFPPINETCCFSAALRTPPARQSVGTDESDNAEAIRAAFNKHFEYFKTEMYRRLAKDNNGNNDTYVLYDVQMHMQNAAIYADERGDKEMLARLLELCLIPLEPRHMTDGKWLNNRYGLIGVEVDLCIAQYFALLTRVLSACQRHGVATRLSDENSRIVTDHLDQWLEKPVNRTRVDDRHLFFVQSTLQFHDYMQNAGRTIDNVEAWQRYVKSYLEESITPKWEIVKHNHDGKEYDCWMLDRTGWADHFDYRFAGYGSEITRNRSDTDPNAMFRSDGTAKQTPKPLPKVATDVSHARRFNWFFETVKRFGAPFDVSISDETLEGWANNLAFRVSRGTLEDPHFTVFSDGVDGWYRVGYRDRKSFGYAVGDCDIYFVASSYGIFGAYNSRIRDWMRSWARKHKTALAGYHGGHALDYLTSLEINMKQPLKGMD